MHMRLTAGRRYYMDGGVAAFIPRPPTPCAVKVCCFPVNELLSKVQGRVAKYDRVASLLDVAIRWGRATSTRP